MENPNLMGHIGFWSTLPAWSSLSGESPSVSKQDNKDCELDDSKHFSIFMGY